MCQCNEIKLFRRYVSGAGAARGWFRRRPVPYDDQAEKPAVAETEMKPVLHSSEKL